MYTLICDPCFPFVSEFVSPIDIVERKTDSGDIMRFYDMIINNQEGKHEKLLGLYAINLIPMSYLDPMTKEEGKKEIKKQGWHMLLSAAIDRNILVLDSDDMLGDFTSRLVSLMKAVYYKHSNCENLTDIFMGEIVWERFTKEAEKMTRCYGVNLWGMEELNVGGSLHKFYSDKLGGSLAGDDENLCVGIGSKEQNMLITVSPVTDPLEYGMVVGDKTKVLLGSF